MLEESEAFKRKKELDVPDFIKFHFPLIRGKKPYPKLEPSSPEDMEKNIADLASGVARHFAEVIEELKDCKCPKCITSDDS